MRLLHPTRSRFSRSALLVGSLCLALAGCAAKNPLMDAAPLAKSKPTAEAAVKTAAAAPSGTVSGTQTSGPTGMARVLGALSPYKIDIQQGNFVSKEMISQLKIGMTTDQVRFVLGTPMLSDIFHADRWHYPFRIQKGNGEVTVSNVAVYFKDGRLERFEGGDLPTEQDYLARIAGKASKDTAAQAAAANAAPASTATPQ